VGEVKKSAFKGEELTLDEDKIFWNFESKEVTSAFSATSHFLIHTNVKYHKITFIFLCTAAPGSVQ